MVLDKVNLSLLVCGSFDELADGAQVVCSVIQGSFTSGLQRIDRIFLRQVLEADERTHSFHATYPGG